MNWHRLGSALEKNYTGLPTRLLPGFLVFHFHSVICERTHFSHRSHYSRYWQEVNPQSRWNLNDQRQTIVFQPSIVFFQCGTQPMPIHLLKLFQRTNARVNFFCAHCRKLICLTDHTIKPEKLQTADVTSSSPPPRPPPSRP